MPPFSIKTSKLLMEARSDSAAGSSFIAQPDKKLEDKIGVLFGIIELFAINDNFIDEFFEIISDLKTEYYLPPLETEYGIEKRFEECLQRANRRISKIIQKSIIKIELQNINTIIGLVHRQKIYLSQIGKNNGFLFHQKNKYDCEIVDIFGQTADKKQKIDPEKMFSNIVSGEITSKDSLIFCNDAILSYTSQNRLSEIITSYDVASAAKKLESELAAHGAKNNFYSVIIQPAIGFEPATIKAEADRNRQDLGVPPQTSITRLIETQRSTEGYLAPSLMPNWKKFLLLLGRLCKKTVLFIYHQIKKIIILIARLIKKGLDALVAAWRSSSERRRLLKSTAAEKIIDETVSTETEITDEPINIVEDKPEEIRESKSSQIAMDYGRDSGKKLSLNERLSHIINRQISRFVALTLIQKIILTTGLVLIFIFSQSIVWKGQIDNTTQSKNQLTIVKQIEEAINNAEASNIFNDETNAKKSLEEARQLLAQLPNKKAYQTTRNELNARIEKLNFALQKITYIEKPEVVVDLSSRNASLDAADFTKVGNFILAFDNNNKNIYRYDLGQKQTTTTASNLSNNLIKMVRLNDDVLVALMENSDLYNYNIRNNKWTKSFASKNEIKDISAYGGKIYTLETTKNQVYKHLTTAAGWGVGSAWIKDKSDLSQALAIAIDGGMYILSTDKQLTYYASGTTVKNGAPDIRSSVDAINEIFTDAESKYIYILDIKNQKVALFNKTGDLKTQYTSKAFGNIKSMTVDEKNGKIYLLADNKILSIDIKL